jgi:pimeloyl-ACP methyl ester carboxylesterase
LASFEQPLLFIFGKNDVYISWETAQALTQKFPQAQTAVLEYSGHCGFYEEPAASAEALIAWVTNTEVKK